MTWLLHYKLKKLSQKADPSPVFVRSLANRIQAELGPSLWQQRAWKWAVVSLSTVSLVGSSTAAYAYTSDGVLPDHPLYGVRESVERVEEALSFTPKQKAKTHVKMLERRLRENQQMQEKRIPIKKERIQKFTDQLHAVIDESGKLTENDRETFDETVDSLETHNESILNVIRDQAPSIEEKQRIEETLQKQKDRLKRKINSLEEKRREHFKNIRSRN